MRILCATDFSPPSVLAAQLGAQLAKRLGAQLTLLHAVEPLPVLATDTAANTLPLVDAEMVRAANAALSEEAGRLGELGVAVTRRLIETFPEHAVRAVIDDERPDLVVVGRTGKGAAARAFLGSVSERVAEGVKTPVLVVGEDHAGLLAAVRGERRASVLVAVDESAASDAPIAWVKSLRRLMPCDATFVRYYWPPEEAARIGKTGGQGTAEIDAQLYAHLDKKVGALPGEGERRLVVTPTWARYGDAIAHSARELSADLVVVGARQARGLSRLAHPSASRELLHASTAPVVCVPAGAVPTPVAVPDFHRVLVAVDFSAQSPQVVAHAASLVRATRGVLELVHVAGSRGGMKQEEVRAIEAELRSVAPAELAELGITVRTSVAFGKVAPTLVLLAERFDADALCTGTRGRTGLQAMLGSVAREVVERSRRPVFLVPTRA